MTTDRSVLTLWGWLEFQFRVLRLGFLWVGKGTSRAILEHNFFMCLFFF
jgi:hypothetical protein